MYPERYFLKKPVTRWEKFYGFFWIGHASETGIRINGVLCIFLRWRWPRSCWKS